MTVPLYQAKAEFFKTLGHPARIRILELLAPPSLGVVCFRANPGGLGEAALDDVNLGRLLTLMEQLREKSQLIIITHQKRTMEVGDALYGVTMRGDGVSAVISQRLRETEPA